jgi:oligoendopeptidase F
MTYFLTGPTPILKESALMPKSILDHAPVRAAATAHGTDSQLGTLPGWNLDDLYPGPESAEFKTDLAAARPAPKPSRPGGRARLPKPRQPPGMMALVR